MALPKSNSKKETTKVVKGKPSGKAIVDTVHEMSPDNPIPFEGGRAFSVVADSLYLPFLSSDDNYAALLLQSRLLSATHDACIRTKKDYCAGHGFQTVDEQDITDAKFNAWCESVNLKDESATEVNKQIFEYFFTFGNVPIELVRFKVGNEKRFYVYVHNFLEWRLSLPDEEDGISHHAVQSKLFLRNEFIFDAKALMTARKLPIYNPRNLDKSSTKLTKGYNWIKDNNGAERTLIWYKNSTAGFPNYGIPSSVASLIYQKLEYKAARYNLDNLDNNMVVNAILALKGNLTQPEINRIGRKIVSTHTGDGKRGRVMVVGSEDGIQGSDIHNIDTKQDGSFTDSDVMWTQKIILANQWDAILAGIVSGSTIGKGVGFLTKIIEVKKNTVIIPAQNDLIKKVWKRIIDISSAWMGFKIDGDKIQVKNTIDISGLTDVDITPVVTVDEVRQAKGLPKAGRNGDKMLGELGADQKKGVYVKDSGTKKTSNSEPNTKT